VIEKNINVKQHLKNLQYTIDVLFLFFFYKFYILGSYIIIQKLIVNIIIKNIILFENY
jgi:hypothetical protein